MGTLAERSTERLCIDSSTLRLRLLATFGVDIDSDEIEWTCAHGDLHWANLTAPHLCLLDWEAWGMAPAGYDPAVLYCASIFLNACIRDQVHATFADLLDSPSGRVAQLAAILKLLCLVEDGEHLDIAVPLQPPRPHPRRAGLVWLRWVAMSRTRADATPASGWFVQQVRVDRIADTGRYLFTLPLWLTSPVVGRPQSGAEACRWRRHSCAVRTASARADRTADIAGSGSATAPMVAASTGSSERAGSR